VRRPALKIRQETIPVIKGGSLVSDHNHCAWAEVPSSWKNHHPLRIPYMSGISNLDSPQGDGIGSGIV
jgi:hypothetical protein